MTLNADTQKPQIDAAILTIVEDLGRCRRQDVSAALHAKGIFLTAGYGGQKDFTAALQRLRAAGKVTGEGGWWAPVDQFANIEWIPCTEPEVIPAGAGASLRRLLPSLR